VPNFPTPIRGIVPPLVTPLQSRTELDRDGLERLVEHLIGAGVAGVFVLGTTGEAPSLSYRLRYEMVEQTCEIVAGRIPVLVGVTDTSLEEAVDLSKFAKDTGAHAVVAAPPYYFTVGQSEVRDYLLDLADDSALPLFIYNMPSCVKISLAFETVEQLSSHTNICGVKDSSGDIDAFRKLLELRKERPDWSILIGPEHLTAESVLMGGDGGVAGGANLNPALFVNIFRAAERRDQAEIDRLQADIVSLGRLYSAVGDGAAGYLQGLKSALSVTGLCAGQLAAPFRSVDETGRRKIAAIVESLGLNVVDQSTVR
jgi:dihydrodipicolinate synthase/N-acetylneuraminate lyase